jgi:hypothetical protein
MLAMMSIKIKKPGELDTAGKVGLDGRIQVYIGCGHPIQTQARATK